MTTEVSKSAVEIEGDALAFLMELIDTPAPSGFEEPAAAVWRAYAESFSEVQRDSVGNSYAIVNKGATPRFMVTGHLDEIGLIVTKIDDKGFIRATNIGGWDIGVLIGQRVRILSEEEVVFGSIGRGAIHQIEVEARKKMPKLKDLWIDIGAEDGDDARARVRVGDPIVLDAAPIQLNGNRLMSRSLDDRLGAFIALEVARKLKGESVEVTALGATQEETGHAGALTGTYTTAPDVAIAIDVTASSDTPAGLDGHTLELGKGPIVTRGASTTTTVSDGLILAAQEAGIPIQLRGLGTRTATDADAMVRAGTGRPVGLISIPTRYLHSPCEQADLRDVRATIDLIVAWAKTL